MPTHDLLLRLYIGELRGRNISTVLGPKKRSVPKTGCSTNWREIRGTKRAFQSLMKIPAGPENPQRRYINPLTLHQTRSFCWPPGASTVIGCILQIFHRNKFDLVGGWGKTPLKNMSSSVGMMKATHYFWENIKFMATKTTNQ